MNVYNNKNTKHQYADGECGMYALYTIITLLEKNIMFLILRIKKYLIKK